MKPVKTLDTSREKWLTTKKIVIEKCPTCGYDRAILTHSDIASAGLITCNNPDCKETIREI